MATLEQTVGDLRELTAIHDRLVRQFDDESRREQETAAAIARDRSRLPRPPQRKSPAPPKRLPRRQPSRAQHIELLAFRKEESVLSARDGRGPHTRTGDRGRKRRESAPSTAGFRSRRNSLAREPPEREEQPTGLTPCARPRQPSSPRNARLPSSRRARGPPGSGRQGARIAGRPPNQQHNNARNRTANYTKSARNC